MPLPRLAIPSLGQSPGLNRSTEDGLQRHRASTDMCVPVCYVPGVLQLRGGMQPFRLSLPSPHTELKAHSSSLSPSIPAPTTLRAERCHPGGCHPSLPTKPIQHSVTNQAKWKHMTTYQHTLAEANSTHAVSPRGRWCGMRPPADSQGSRKRWGHPPLRTAGPFGCCRLGPPARRRAPNHILQGKKTRHLWNSILPAKDTSVPEHEDEEEAPSFDPAGVKLCKGSVRAKTMFEQWRPTRVSLLIRSPQGAARILI